MLPFLFAPQRHNGKWVMFNVQLHQCVLPSQGGEMVLSRQTRDCFMASWQLAVVYFVCAGRMNDTPGCCRPVVHGWVMFNADVCCPALCEALAGQQANAERVALAVLEGSLESLQRSKTAQAGRADPRQRYAAAQQSLATRKLMYHDHRTTFTSPSESIFRGAAHVQGPTAAESPRDLSHVTQLLCCYQTICLPRRQDSSE